MKSNCQEKDRERLSKRGERTMHLKRRIALLLSLGMLLGLMATASAAKSDEPRVEFQASEIDKEGRFTLKMTAYDVKFNGFQFVMRYDPATVSPIDDKGQATESFSRCYELLGQEDEEWLAMIGTDIDKEKGLIEFSGYVQPGKAVAVGKEEQSGFAVIGEDGLDILEIHLKKLGDQPVMLELAEEDDAKPFQSYMPNGGGVFDTGYEVPARIYVSFPEQVGTSVEREPNYGDKGSSSQTAKPTMTRDQRLKDTVILQIGNAAASVEGKLTTMYPGEPGVTAYAHDDRTFVPVRFVAESLGAKVDWVNETQTVVIKTDAHTVTMAVGSDIYTVDGSAKVMDAPAEFKQDPDTDSARTMVPLRFVAEALGMDVKWDQATNAVIVSPADAPWDLKGTLEKEILSDTVLMLSPLVQSFVN